MPTNPNTSRVLREPVDLVVLECVFPEAPGGAGSDQPVATLTMVWPDETQGGKNYRGTLHNLPQLGQVDDDDYEEEEETDLEEEDEERLPTDRPQFSMQEDAA